MKKVSILYLCLLCVSLVFSQEINVNGKPTDSVISEYIPKDTFSGKAYDKETSLEFGNAMMKFREKNYTEALLLFGKVNKKLELGIHWEFIGRCHYGLGDYSSAADAYEKALVVSPDIAQRYHYQNAAGIAYAKNNQFEEAKIAFETYKELLPRDYLNDCLNWLMWYALQDKKDEAIEQLRIAVKSLGFSDVKWLKNNDGLDSIREEKEFKRLLRKTVRNKRWR